MHDVHECWLINIVDPLTFEDQPIAGVGTLTIEIASFRRTRSCPPPPGAVAHAIAEEAVQRFSRVVLDPRCSAATHTYIHSACFCNEVTLTIAAAAASRL